MNERRGPGAPPGLTVHWLEMELRLPFRKDYKLIYNPNHHYYHYVRHNKRTLVDEFIVIRTSKRCYRVMYFNANFKYFQYFSARNYRECAERMIRIYTIFKRLEAKKPPKPPKKPKKGIGEKGQKTS